MQQKLTICTAGSNTCNMNSPILTEQNESVEHSSNVILNSAILK